MQNVPLDEAFLKFRGDVRAGQATSGNTGDSLPDVDFAALKKEYDALDSISGRASEIEWVEFIQQYYSDACAMFDAGKGDMSFVMARSLSSRVLSTSPSLARRTTILPPLTQE